MNKEKFRFTGLSAAEVTQRENENKVNVEIRPESKTIKDICKDNIFTYFNLIFCILALILIAARSFHNMLFMFVVVIHRYYSGNSSQKNLRCPAARFSA